MGQEFYEIFQGVITEKGSVAVSLGYSPLCSQQVVPHPQQGSYSLFLVPDPASNLNRGLLIGFSALNSELMQSLFSSGMYIPLILSPIHGIYRGTHSDKGE